ncbi:MAG: amidohydrolase family protein [Bacteroidetes bacterium]|jgi:imidazolonepropionase-like amidohydrolase|nr:amidohydrolase family protein [Bacteroidota bacterium]MDA1383050.1 amidohydrolase family protein [Bacteroidota bacterium]
MRYAILFILTGLVSTASFSQQTPAPEQTRSILILGGTAHLGTGDAIEDAAIGFRDGKIDFVGRTFQADQSKYDETIDATGKQIYPGFIVTNSTIGLQEIDAVRATQDQYEVGTFRPNVRAIIAFNTDSEITPTVRSNGVLMGQITPRSGVISGASGVVQFDGWNWEDASIKMVDGIHLNWPSTHHKHAVDGKIDIRKRKTYTQQKHEIERYFEEARAYAEAHPEPSTSVMDVRHEAMRGIFDGSLALYCHASDVREITEAVHFKREMGIKRLVIVGGYDAYLVGDILRENNVSVLLTSVHRLPRFTEDEVDLPYRLPKLLADEGVLFALQVDARMTEMNSRNLPFYAGTARKYGLTEEQAIMALTRNPAKILGVDDVCGTIERGKDATLFISDGDALDVRTNRLIHAFIQGRTMDLDNRQKELYRKFQTKYGAELLD